MRTKLDEIVGEERSNWIIDGNQTFLDRIAERAFRHGVEQSEEACSYLIGSDVQPAPAEEKGVLSKAEARTEGWGICEWVKEARDLATMMIYDEDTKKCLLVLASSLEAREPAEEKVDPFAPGGPLAHQRRLRRYGERRIDGSRLDKGTNFYTTGMRDPGGAWVYEWLPNRRSDKDRRKP